jgi:hypothetical protein
MDLTMTNIKFLMGCTTEFMLTLQTTRAPGLFAVKDEITKLMTAM